MEQLLVPYEGTQIRPLISHIEKKNIAFAQMARMFSIEFLRPFCDPLIPLFCTSGDPHPGFQKQAGSLACVSCHLRATDSSNSPLV